MGIMDFFSPAAESETPAPVQSEPIEDIEIIPENEVPKGSPPVDLSAEFAELNQESGNVMAEDDLRKMTTQGEETAADEALDPSQMYSGISMANDRINALQTELKMLTKRKKQMELAGKSKQKFKKMNSTNNTKLKMQNAKLKIVLLK